MHNPESVLKNDTHKIRWNLEIQMDHVILSRRLKQVIVDKKGDIPNCELCRPVRSRNKIKRK